VVNDIELTPRQAEIVKIVRENQPITSEQIAERLNLTRATLRPDLAILSMTGILDARPRVGYFFTGKSVMDFISERIHQVKVKDIKKMPVIIQENASVYEAIVTLFLEDTGTLFVISDSGFLSGVVSRKDLLKIAIGGSDIHKIPVGVVMTRMPNVVTTTLNDSAYEAAVKIAEREVDALPVVEHIEDDTDEIKLKVVGKITKTTITKLFVELGKNN
jgi:CBS domain-containing protein